MMQVPSILKAPLARLSQAWHERAILLKAISFAMIGVINTAVDAGVFFLIFVLVTSPLIGADPASGQVLVGANVTSWLVAVSGSYVMNSHITFAAETGRTLSHRSYAKFVVSGLAGLIANTTALVIAAQFLPIWGAKGISILVAFLVNFSISHFFVFRPRKPVS